MEGRHAANTSLYPQLDQLVGTLDHSVFAAMRVHLLDPEAHQELFVCLSSLLELLPQSVAAHRLRRLLKTVPVNVFVCLNRLVYDQKAAKRQRGHGFMCVGNSIRGSEGRIVARKSNLGPEEVCGPALVV